LLRTLWRRIPSDPPPPQSTLIFLHIPKTAGISLRRVLIDATAPHRAFRIIVPIDDHDRLAALPRQDRAALALVEGHMYYGVHEILPLPCHYITMLRDPVERVLSYYSFVREWKEHHLHGVFKGLSLAECIDRRLTVELDNFQVRALTDLSHVGIPFGGITCGMLVQARAHLDGFAFVGLTEKYDRSLALLCRRFGWSHAPREHLNATAQRTRREDLDAGTLQRILDANRLDVELYAYASRLFEARAAAAAIPDQAAAATRSE
jgi:hypothetical protein